MPTAFRFLIAGLVALTPGQTTTPSLEAQTGLLVVAHGAGPEWNDRVLETVGQVRWNGPVATAFLMGPAATTAGFREGVNDLVARGARDIVVVPLMVSSWGAHFRQIRYYAGELEELPAALAGHDHGGRPERPVPMRVTPALDDAPELSQALQVLWAALDSAARARPLYFVAHGPTTDADAAQWLANTRRVLGRTGITVPVDVGLLRDDAPAPVRAAAVAAMRRRINELAGPAGDSVTVLPLLISTGQITTVKIPADLAGLPVGYVPAAITPSSHIAAWIERVAAEAVSPVDAASSRGARSGTPRPGS